MKTERLQKFLARRGICSRRSAEQLILDGRVSVNETVITVLGSRVDPEADYVTVDDEEVPRERKRRVLMLHKPYGFLSTSKPDQESGKSVLELVPGDRRFFSVGRLDRDTTGLLLITDDGDLAYTLTHPRFGIEKVYLVETKPAATPQQIEYIKSGVPLEDGVARVKHVKRVDRRVLELRLTEGKNREIRRLMKALDLHVLSLHRASFGGLVLGTLPPGKWRELQPTEIQNLKSKSQK